MLTTRRGSIFASLPAKHFRRCHYARMMACRSPSVRRHLKRLLKGSQRVAGTCLSQPRGRRLRSSSLILNGFLVPSVRLEFGGLLEPSPLATDALLASLHYAFGHSELSSPVNRGGIEGSFGYAHRTSWNQMVVALATWCTDNNISTAYHARSEHGLPSPLSLACGGDRSNIAQIATARSSSSLTPKFGR